MDRSEIYRFVSSSACSLGARVQRLLHERTILILAVLLALGMGTVLAYMNRLQSNLVQAMALRGTALHAQSLEVLRAYYTAEVVERVHALGIEAAHDFRNRTGTIPLPITLTLETGRMAADRDSGLTLRLYSEHPFPWREDGGPRDEFEREALARLKQDPDTPVVRFQETAGNLFLRYAVADRLRAQCVRCHNSHPDSPKTDWKEGDMLGVVELTRQITPVAEEAQAALREAFIVIGAVSLLGLAGIGLVMSKLRRTAVELEQRVGERTRALQELNTELQQEITDRRRIEHELRRTETELKRSNAELEQFACVTSHDLQEPLRTVTSYLELIQHRYEDQLGPDGRDFIRSAVNGGRRMKGLIHDLLAYSRVTSRARPLEATDCAAVLKTVLANLQAAIHESGAVVTWDPLPTVMADPVQWTQLIQNLIGNALKFRGADAPRIHVRARRDGEDWRFTIQDNGIGIDPKFFERIFAIFQRLHGRDQYPGSGVGLALCKKIVERHGGRIWVESQQGAGAMFHFTIPVHRTERP